MDFPQLMLYAIPFFFLAMWLEYKHNKQEYAATYTKSEVKTNITLGVGSIIIAAATSLIFTPFYNFLFENLKSFRLGVFGYEEMGWGVLAWIGAVLADDFVYYWFHRTAHRIRIFWACHVVHHSSDHFNFSNAVRNGWVSYVYKHIFWCAIAAAGFHPIMIFTCASISNIYTFFLHTTVKTWWDKLSWILNTPGLHAVHHGSIPYCIDKNYGGIFTIWDRLFGSYEPLREGVEIRYGVTHPPKSNALSEVLFHEFRSLFKAVKKTTSWKDKILILLKPPGWRPKPETRVKKLQTPVFELYHLKTKRA